MFQTFEDHSSPELGAERAEKVRIEMAKNGLAGLIVPHDDEYQNEYTPACFERLAWLTGFTGSAGVAVVLDDKAAIFVDGRYTLAARDQVDTAVFEIVPIVEKSVGEWLLENASPSSKIGFDATLHTEASILRLRKETSKVNLELVPTGDNLVDAVWSNRPGEPMEMIVPHPVAFAGRSSEDKRNDVAAKLIEQGADVSIVTSPASIAWLLNIRGGDVAHTPLPLCRSIIDNEGRVSLYANENKISDELLTHLGNSVSVQNPEDFLDALTEIGKSKKTALVDPSSTPFATINQLDESGACIIRAEDPCVLPRATKNQTELDGTRSAHHRDGAALSRFLCWLESATKTGVVDEITAVQKLESLRAENGDLRDISFETISGAGPNGAIVHYRVTEQTNRTLEPGTLFLVDSGGQYLDGTTDVTRTIAIGSPSDEHKDRFTRVLKGHIGLAAARFPEGTTGAELDVLARLALWKAGLNFDHGTGHGVGSYLGVHEGPQSISKRSFSVALKPGMIVSNEPGYYKTGDYGIRIENLVIVSQPIDIEGGERPMMGFETITLAPIDLNLVNPSLLTAEETTWLNAYHNTVRNVISPLVDDTTTDWLKKATEPLA